MLILLTYKPPLLRCLFLLAWLIAYNADGYCQQYRFRSYQVENGLSNNSVFAICQDREGFIWFGTKDGLDRFDGYSFKTFKKSDRSPGSIGNNFIHALKTDDQGTLWIGTDDGVYKYSAQYESFRLIPETKGHSIHGIFFDRENNLWITFDFGIGRYAVDEKRLFLFRDSERSVFTGLALSPGGEVWASTTEGVLKKYIPSRKAFIDAGAFSPPYQWAERGIGFITFIDSTKILISKPSSAVKLFDTRTSSIRTIPFPVPSTKSLLLRAITQASANEFWIASESGIFIYNTTTGKIARLQKQIDNPASLSDNKVYCIYKDKQEGIWVGTYYGGVNYCKIEGQAFQTFTPSWSANSISGSIVREIKEDLDGNVWIGTEDAGLNKFNPRTGKFTHFFESPRSGSSISFNNIKGLLASGRELWVGTFLHGLDVLDMKSGKVIRKYKQGAKSGLGSNFILSICETSNGQKLVGTAEGLYKYHPDKDYFKPFDPFPRYKWYSFITEGRKGMIYACVGGEGVYYYDQTTGRLGNLRHSPSNPNSLSSNRVNSCLEDSSGDLWLATEDGLCRWRPSSQSFQRFGIDEGFPGNNMLSILEDHQGALWVSTTRGLVQFNPRTLKTRAFTTAEGLPGDQFHYNSALKTSDGRMYFGSIKGLTCFDPGNFPGTNYLPPIYLTRMEINNMEINNMVDSGILKYAITHTRSITLNHDQSSFNLEFAALDYNSPSSQSYAFKLEGLSGSWTFLGKNRKVYFSQVPPGSYAFKVKASNGQGHWGQEVTMLHIRVLAPWWRSTPAYAFYLITAALLLLLGARLYHAHMKLKSDRRIASIQLAKEKELIESKIDFFINAAHEIRTPLTLIKIPLRTIGRLAANIPEMAASLKIINYNTDRLIELSNQFLNFRETEVSGSSLHLTECNVSEILTASFESFKPLAEENNIDFRLYFPDTPVYAMADVDFLKKIFFNLLSNAIKYTRSKVEVNIIQPINRQEQIRIEVRNDGALIPEEFRDKIFEPFFRIKGDGQKDGTGIGLPLARSLVCLLGGELKYFADEQSMNVFLITLPNG